MRKLLSTIVLMYAFLTNAYAVDLDPVVNLQINGDVLTWGEVDGATGYNIYQRGYYATVRGGNSFTLTEVGTYSVAAFNDAGDFGPLRGGEQITYTGGEDNRTDFFTYTDDIVYRTVRCFDVEAGGNCAAECPDFIADSDGPGDYISSATGGACSSSDTININSHIGPKIYSCTVSSFTSRLEAQVACMVDSDR